MQSGRTTQGEHELDDALTADSPRRRLIDYVFFQASAEVNHEQAQAIARIAISGGIFALLAVLWLLGKRGGDGHLLNIWAVGAYALFSVAYFAALRRHRERYTWRRYLTILSDLGITAFATYNQGLPGLGVYPLFLWIMIGNGLRFGARFMRVAVVVGVAGFVAATLANGLFQTHPGVVGGLLVGMLVMPKFFLVMVKRLAAANELLHRQKQLAEYRATHDELTGLPNRALLEDRLQQALRKFARRPGRIAVIFIDLDGFKAINDNFGHDAGDALLRELAACLQRRLRAADTVARLGGDEFILLVEDCGSAEEVAAVIDQLAACVGRSYGVGRYQTYLSWSCGVAMYPEDGRDAVSLIQHADTAMYQAKAAGDGSVRFYDPQMTAQVATQLGLRDELRRAVEQDELVVHYQPQVTLPAGRVTGLEALVRWQHPERGLLPPGEFFTVAEQTGLLAAIGRRVLQQVAADLAAWRRRGLALDLPVHLNVSPRQLADGGLREQVGRILAQSGLPPSALGVELTEPIALADVPKLGEEVQALRDLGLAVALDDFGDGSSSLGYLRHVRVDRIKVDRTLVAAVPGNARDSALFEAVLALGARLGIEVVAQGVERPEQADWLIAAGCCLAQGRLYGAPAPPQTLDRLLGGQAAVGACR